MTFVLLIGVPLLLWVVGVYLLRRYDGPVPSRGRGSCPSCGYDMRGLVLRAACPECGRVPGDPRPLPWTDFSLRWACLASLATVLPMGVFLFVVRGRSPDFFDTVGFFALLLSSGGIVWATSAVDGRVPSAWKAALLAAMVAASVLGQAIMYGLAFVAPDDGYKWVRYAAVPIEAMTLPGAGHFITALVLLAGDAKRTRAPAQRRGPESRA